jgi:hypothetical protein
MDRSVAEASQDLSIFLRPVASRCPPALQSARFSIRFRGSHS